MWALQATVAPATDDAGVHLRLFHGASLTNEHLRFSHPVTFSRYTLEKVIGCVRMFSCSMLLSDGFCLYIEFASGPVGCGALRLLNMQSALGLLC